MNNTSPLPFKTSFTNLMGCDFPIIAAPMFLVSNEAMVTEASNAGGVGAAPSLNWRSTEQFGAALDKIRAGTNRPYGVNLIVNKSNLRAEQDLETIRQHQVPMVITSLGNPKAVIEAVHSYGGKVFCDVVDLKYAQKVQDLGADGVIAVSSGAGGHAGPVSPMVLIPYLKQHLKIPVVAAGGIATGKQILAAIILGADAVQIGTRFIATAEAGVSQDYKNAVLKAEPEDIVLTKRISGTPAAVINTPFIQKMGLELPPIEAFLRKHPLTAKYAKLLRYMQGTKSLEAAAQSVTWKTVWSAGQGVGLIHDIRPTADVMRQLMTEFWEARNAV
ncbi:MAG: nitronate monooxygenase [Micavibrio aeruginosavorus]|uniref:Nitronate monooxygenase n=1 Tax=Micavibrio aeruginosavorus TaxID=349221 RepID=A0A2W5MX38_9BACT|nr:MAG: nitronate monooxygenase [Micavibrio aeruginosavorus]